MENRTAYRSGCGAVALLLVSAWCTAPLAVAAEEAKVEKRAAIAPVGLDRAKLAGIGLPAEEAFIESELILSGKSNPRGEVLFRGEELVVEIYEDDAVKIRVNEPFAHDEFITLLSGDLILTDAAGVERKYVAGDSLVVPKGFTGIWEMRGNFRELVVIERKIYDATYPSE